MRRIGLAASKIAQGNLFKYNIFVVAIATLCATILFLVSSIAMLVVLFLVSLMVRWLMPAEFSGSWWGVIKITLSILAMLIGLLNGWAIVQNFRLSRPKS